MESSESALLDENDGPIKGESRYEEGYDLLGREIGFPHGQDKGRPTHDVIQKKIGPIDSRVGLKKVFANPFGVCHGKLIGGGFHR
jgi:hypothetical protein